MRSHGYTAMNSSTHRGDVISGAPRSPLALQFTSHFTCRHSLLRLIFAFFTFITFFLPLVDSACPRGSGSDGYITINGNALNVASPNVALKQRDFTFEAWVRRTRNTVMEFWIGVGSKTDNDAYFHGGFRSGLCTMSFWGSDLDCANSPSSLKTLDFEWHHWAYRYQHDGRIRTVWRDGIQLANDKASRSCQNEFAPWSIGSVINGGYAFVGDIDELMYYNTPIPDDMIRAHAAGNYQSTSNYASGCRVWYKFNENGGTTAYDNCERIPQNNAIWNGATGWKTENDDHPKCFPLYFNGFMVQLPVSFGRVGRAMTVRIIRTDQFGRSLEGQGIQLTPISITITSTGTTSISSEPAVVFLNDEVGQLTVTGYLPESVTFTLTDSGQTGKSVTIISPVLTYFTPDLSGIFMGPSPDMSNSFAMTPPYSAYKYSYSFPSVPYETTTLWFWASFSQSPSTALTVNGTEILSLANGIPILLNINEGTNTFELISSEPLDGSTYAYRITIIRRGPDLTNIVLVTEPNYLSIAPNAFQVRSTQTREVEIPGDLRRLSVTFTFTLANSVTMTMNGIPFTGPIESGVNYDLSASVLSPGVNLFTATSEGFTYTYSLKLGCPRELKCRPTPGATQVNMYDQPQPCPYTCTYCMGNIYRSICQLPRADCCGQAGCAC